MAVLRTDALGRALAGLVGPDAVRAPAQHDLRDASEVRSPVPADDLLVVAPADAEQARQVVELCYARDIAMVPRGGGTGLAGGAVPLAGGVIVDSARMRAVRLVEPSNWQLEVEAGVPTAHVRRIALENGLVFPPDPGAGEQSLNGGNVATNAGGPHAFDGGVTGDWVTAVEAVVAPGRLVRFGSGLRKDVAGLDLKRLLVGSEGTLGVITAARLRLRPAPGATRAVVAFYPDAEAGQAGVFGVLASGAVPTVCDFLDRASLAATAHAFPGDVPAGAGFVLLCEVEGATERAAADALELVCDGLAPGALAVTEVGAPHELWRWRDTVSGTVAAQEGAKVSEDIAVPLDRLADALHRTSELGAEHALPSCAWGHAGDGNVHVAFLVDPVDVGARGRAAAAVADLFRWAVDAGGTLSGEHGIGVEKQPFLAGALGPEVDRLQRAVKQAFDPKGLFNPGTAL